METLSKNMLKEKKQYKEKVLQFGEGNFMRAFVDWQIDMLNKKANFNGSAVAIQPRGQKNIQKLKEQDGLYTLFLQGIKDGKRVREHTIIEAIGRGIDLYSEYNDFVRLAENPDLRFIFSNTTEAGIAFNEDDRLDDRPQKSFPARLTAFLYYRCQAFNGAKNKGFIIIPCELIERNGEELKRIILQYAELWSLDQAFVQWIHEANTFCSSLVDRIVPGYPHETADEMMKELGYKDELLVVGEPFHLWVIEGPQWILEEFPVHRTDLQTIVVDDLAPYRTRKVRILNGAHTAMTPVAYLYGVNTVAEAIEDETIGTFTKELIFEEIIPTLDLPPDELKSFADAVLERFQNPFIHHFLMSISLNSVSKYKTRNLPSLLEYVERRKQLPQKLVFSLAALCAFYKGERGTEQISLSDEEEILQLFKEQWDQYDGSFEGTRTIAFNLLRSERCWGMNLNELPGLTEAVAKHLFIIESKGMKEALTAVLSQHAPIGEEEA